MCIDKFAVFSGWSGDLVTEAWKQDSYAACQKAGLSREMLEGNRRREVSMSLHEVYRWCVRLSVVHH